MRPGRRFTSFFWVFMVGWIVVATAIMTLRGARWFIALPSGLWVWPLGIFLVAVILVYASWIYQTTIGLAGLWDQARMPRYAAASHFLVLVPAHNEEKVIGHLLQSLHQQSYPRTHFDVYVACDNCVDATADVARAHGAQAMIRPPDPERSGKTWNVRWAMAHLPLERYDALMMFDADNVVDREFLASMNDFLVLHPKADAVQGYLDTKNPDDSWITRVSALAYWGANRFWQLARANWGLSAHLGGTGMLITTTCLRRTGWELRSLTEDLEYTAKLILEGSHVDWNDYAIVYDEKPTAYRASRKQRTRWLQGHYWVMWHYAGPCVRKFLTTGRLQYLDLLFYLLSPGRMAIAFLSSVAGLLVPITRFALDPHWLSHDHLWWLWFFWPVSAVAQTVLEVIIAPSLRFQRFTLRFVPDAVTYLFYGFTWAPMVFKAAFLARNQGTWVKTEHTRAMGVEETQARGSR